MKRAIVVALVLLAPVFVHASDTNGDGHETILVPIAFLPDAEVAGALGTRWHGGVWVANEASHEINLLRYTCGLECSALYPPGYVGPVRSPLDVAAGGNGQPGGPILLDVPIDVASQVTFGARIYEVSKRAQPEGVDVPVVREGAFFRQPVTFFALPGGNAVRIALRVYDPRRTNLQVRVDVLDEQGNSVANTNLPVAFDPEQTLGKLVLPGFGAIYDLAGNFPVVTALTQFHLRVTPVQPDAEFWAMVSVTDNETQHVLIVTAH